MVVTALAMATDLDVRFQTALANDFPAFLSNPTRSLERSGAVEDRLADLRGKPKFDSSRKPQSDAEQLTAAAGRYRDLGAAPDFVGNQRWFNTAGDRPLDLAGLRGRVVLIDFWTYTCINCIRTLPYVKAWDARYRKDGLTIVGVHTPEFGFEHDAGNVSRAVAQNAIRYPVAQDNDFATWNAWGNQYWPAKYLIDARGRVRYSHFGEGDYRKTEQAIRALLAERDRGRLGRFARAKVDRPSARLATPETYLGSQKAQGWAEPPADGLRSYRRVAPSALPQSAFALGGKWRVTPEAATAVANATLSAKVVASKVFLVLRSRGERPRRVGVTLDGKRLAPVTVTADKLYTLVSLPRAGEHGLELDVPPGVSGYAFTFG
jgi:thiol-disulfide isomerase/thioredoxin